MTPLVLTLVACLASGDCREHRVVGFDSATPVDPRLPQACLRAARAWRAAHPAWRVDLIRCGPMEFRP